ncbi:MAG TPA: phosphoribosylglycinamide formyltransferase, partial [Ferruginibacter sp.]|nr:phosphoribosylglycinamide formyltransferase [Ferruginibacter sp.]
NADKIIQYFNGHKLGAISLVVSDKADAGVLEIARRNNINTLIINKKQLGSGDELLSALSKQNIKWIVLAGFLQKIPPALVKAYPNRILNIHPALLPKYGGKGMYGMHVHRAVLANQEKESGISIHFVDDHYDHGETIFQASCPVAETDSPETLAKKVQSLEHAHFPRVIEEILQNPR